MALQRLAASLALRLLRPLQGCGKVGLALLLLPPLLGSLAEAVDYGGEVSCPPASGCPVPLGPPSATSLAVLDAAEAVELLQSRAEALHRREAASAAARSGTAPKAAAPAAAGTVGKLGSHSYPDIAEGSWMPPSIPKTLAEKALWLFFPLPVIASIFGIWLFAGRVGLLRTMPMGISVLLLLFVVDNKYLAPFMSQVHFALGSAIVTMVVVMEVGTLEAFCLKTVLRFLGTFFGAALGNGLAHVTGTQGNHPTLVVGISFVFFTVSKAVGSSHPKTIYFFTIASVTFALVFYTPSAAEGRFYSVLVGNVFAFLTTFLINMGFADPYDPETSSLAGLVCNGGRIIGAALHAVDLAFLELHIASARDEEDIREACRQAANGLGEEFWPNVDDALNKCDTLTAMLDAVSATAKEIRQELERRRYEAQIKNEQFQGDVELLRWFCCIRADTLPHMSELVEAADKVFTRANGLAHSMELYMSLGWQILDLKDMMRVEQVRKWLEPVNDHFQQVFEPQIWLPRTRWKAMLVLMAPGLIQSRVGKHRPINRGAAFQAMTEVGKALATADEELAHIWKKSHEHGHHHRRASHTHQASESRAFRFTAQVTRAKTESPTGSAHKADPHARSGMHLLYHGMHLLISDLCSLAKTVLSLQEVDSVENVDALKRKSEVRAEDLRRAQRCLADLAKKVGHRETMMLVEDSIAVEGTGTSTESSSEDSAQEGEEGRLAAAQETLDDESLEGHAEAPLASEPEGVPPAG